MLLRQLQGIVACKKLDECFVVYLTSKSVLAKNPWIIKLDSEIVSPRIVTSNNLSSMAKRKKHIMTINKRQKLDYKMRQKCSVPT